MKEIKPNAIIIKKSNNVAYVIDSVDKKEQMSTIVRLGDGLREHLDFVSVEMQFDFNLEKDLIKDIVSISKTLKNKAKIIQYDKSLNHVVLVESKIIQVEILKALEEELTKFINNSKRNNIILENQIVEIVDRETESCQMFLDRRKEQEKVAASLKSKIVDEITSLKNEEQSDSAKNINFLIIEPDSKIGMNDVIISPITLKSIEQEFSKVEFADFFDNEWGLSDIAPVSGRCNLNFYGPSGTGKTLTVRAFANKLNKKIVQVDFSQLISKYIGDTGKNIKRYFDKARELDAILFFDEADSLMMKRVDSGNDQNSSTVNQNQNIFMQEVDRFQGIIILATNYFQNYDDAVARRFNSVQFNLPDDELRLKLLEKNISKKVSLGADVDFNQLVVQTKGFSGAEIKNVCVNALINKATGIRLSNMEKSKEEILFLLRNTTIKMDSFIVEIKKIAENKKQNSGIIDRTKIGLATTL